MEQKLSDRFAVAEDAIAKDLKACDDAAQELALALGNLKCHGLRQAANAGVHASVIGRVFHYLGEAESHSSQVISALGGVHFELHAVKKRLAPSEPTPQGGAGGGKGDDPPEPVGG